MFGISISIVLLIMTTQTIQQGKNLGRSETEFWIHDVTKIWNYDVLR